MKVMRAGWIALALVALVATPVLASGFSIYEQSAKASGQAGAWVARADDAAANWYNPAALVRNKGMELQIGGNLITIGSDTTFTPSTASFQGVAYTAGSIDSESNLGTPVHLYFAQKISDRIAWGIGINNPYGLKTEWTKRPLTLSAVKSDLATTVVNPNVAFALNDRWALAVGLDYMYADVGEFSREIDQSPLLGAPRGSVYGASNLTGTADDFGWNLAAHFSGEKVKFGLTYRAGWSLDIDGDVDFSGIHPALGPGGPVGTLCGAEGCFPDGPGKAKLELPAQAAVGVAFAVGKAWNLEVDVAWAEWSSFETLPIDFEKNTSAPIGPSGASVLIVGDVTLEERWEDTMSYRFGAAWALRDKHELRFGAIFDEGPSQTETLRPSIPDADRKAATFGYGFRSGKWAFDAYYMPLWFSDSTAQGSTDDLGGTVINGTPFPNGIEDGQDTGVAPGQYETFVHLFGVTLSYRF